MDKKIALRRCNEPTIPAAECKPSETHPAFRAVFLARFISILSLGLLGVAVPVQIQAMTGSSWQVGLSVTLTGGAMFVGLMTGGVLADRYERKN
jgi:ENTS family enterobactin (siderophore) exporter